MNYVTIFELDLEGRIREVFHDLTLHFNYIFFSHLYFAEKPAPLKFAFFSRLSY